MTFPDAVRTCLGKYATFSGRAKRPEYWWFVLFYFVAAAVLNVIDNALGLGTGPERQGGLLSYVFALGMLIPLLAALVRRLHDTGRSGWWALIGLIPIVGTLVLLFFAVQPSSPQGRD